MIPAIADCLVIVISAAVRSLSVVPVLPAIGYLPTIPLVGLAVAPWHSPKNDWSPTGHRAASPAACATSGSTAARHRGFAASSTVPLKSRISSTGSGSQYVPSAATVAYALAIWSGVVLDTPSVNAPHSSPNRARYASEFWSLGSPLN